MPRFILLFLFNLLLTFCVSAQSDYEFMGVLRIGEDAFISYRMAFDENDGIIEGYSLTDMGGEHETKSFISGYFDAKANTLEFNESGILYTKSFVNQADFCFVNFKGELKKLNEKQNIEGAFKGLFSDGKECISGELKLVNMGKIMKQAKKIDKKVDRNVLISKEKKEKVHMVKDLDSMRINRLKRNETLSVFAKNEQITLRVYDSGQEDGDEIGLWVDGKVYQNAIKATTRPKDFKISLATAQTKVKVKAVSNGTVGGNTVAIQLIDGSQTIDLMTYMTKGESAELVFYKK